jgi:hypothetical protein
VNTLVRLTAAAVGKKAEGDVMARWFRRGPAGKLGTVLLAAWLIAWGALQLVPALAFQGSGVVLALLAVAAGVVILLDR